MSFFDLPPIIERMLLVSDKISDLNFSVGQLPQVEINGKLTPVQPLGMQKLTPYQTSGRNSRAAGSASSLQLTTRTS